MASKVRIDRRLVELQLASSRQRAQALIEQGVVKIDGVPATKASTLVDIARAITLDKPDHPWVSRGALKLLSAFDPLGLSAESKTCADLGCSTGGFTEVLLSKGARCVYAVDVGRGLLHGKLRNDPRVLLHEGVNARHLETLPEPIDLLVGDLSFISLRSILPSIHSLLRPGGDSLILIKPQFEVGRKGLGKRGLVRSEQDRLGAIDTIRSFAMNLGFSYINGQDSGVSGARSGNIEHFMHLQRKT
jgi:23S rRNA (cytidine1920-2'-O)/16S rRNA (cytidine1409-2'-O)-methyltransferase